MVILIIVVCLSNIYFIDMLLNACGPNKTCKQQDFRIEGIGQEIKRILTGISSRNESAKDQRCYLDTWDVQSTQSRHKQKRGNGMCKGPMYHR